MDQTKEGDDAQKTAHKDEKTPDDTTSTPQPDTAQVEQPQEPQDSQPAQTTQSQEDSVTESQSGQDTTSGDVVTKAAGEDVVVSETTDQTHSQQHNPEEEDKKSEQKSKGGEEEHVEEQSQKQEDLLESVSGRDHSEDPSVKTTDSTEAVDSPSSDQQNQVADQPEQEPQNTSSEAQADSQPTQPQEPEAAQLSAEAPDTAESYPTDQPLELDSSTVDAEGSSAPATAVLVSGESSAEPEAVTENSELPQDNTAAEGREEKEATAAEADNSGAHEEEDLNQEDALETPAQEDTCEINEDSVDKQEDSAPIPEPKEEIKEDPIVSETVSENISPLEKQDSEPEATLVKSEVSAENTAVTEPCPSSPKPSEQKEGGDSEEQATPDPASEDSKVEPEAEQNLPEEPTSVSKPKAETPRESEPEHTANTEEVSDLQEKSAQIVQESIANAVKVVSEDSLCPEDTARTEVAEPGIAQTPPEETSHSDKDSVSSDSSLSSSTSSGTSTSVASPRKQPKPQPPASGGNLGFLLPDTDTSSPSPREAAEFKESRHTLPPKGEYESVSRTRSRSTPDSANAPVTRSRKRRHQKSASADRRVTFRSPRIPGGTPRETATMGSGVSREGEMEEADPRFAAQSTAAMSHAGSPPRSPPRSKQATLSQHSSLKSSGHMSMARQSRFNMEGLEDAEVRISSDGFNIQEVTIAEGQFVRFICDHSCPNNATLLQVIHDGEELRPVIDGYQISLDERHGSFHQQLNLEGEYKFALTGIRCTPLSVRVRRKTDLPCEVTDEGFVPNTIYIEQGTSIRWSWKQTSVPHTVTEVNYVFDKGCFSRQSPNQSMVATATGTHRQTFNRPGLFYLRTEGSEPGKTHLCIVCVHAVSREYRVEIMDRSFQPMILLIEEGDRVWFSWDRFKCKKAHSVYQIEPPGMDHNEDDAYEPARDGFKWTTPSKQGLMSHRFNKAGVFYFSDQNFEEAAEYIGSIIVKPKQREHVVKLEERGFVPDLLRVNTGERVWWLWDGPSIADVGEGLLLLEDDKVLNPLSKKNNSAEQSEHYQDLDASSTQLMTRVGAATIHFTTVGVYNYKVSDVGDHFSSCSVLVNPGSKNHTVHLTDNGFEPKVITVNCNDRVWWVWQSGKRQHNIVQVSHQGLPIPGGFCSGMARDSPSAFSHQFSTAGVYYFISKTLPQVFGAVVVSTRPQVHEVAVKESELRPDPVTIQLNDVVAWIFGSPKQYDVTQVQSVDQVLDSAVPEKALSSRRCFARGVSQTGYFHFKSRSFQRQKESNKKQDPQYFEDTRLSSVVCDDRCDSIITQLDKKGFHPESVYLQKGQSLLWSWKGTDEEHNIIHVTDPQSAWKTMSLHKTPLNMIKGPRAFNSGRPLPNDSFLYTFDEAGSYTVVSQGAPGFSCTVNVLDVARRTGEPFVSSEQRGGTVDRFSKVFLDCKTSHAQIYYTKDGSRPSTNSRTYHPDRGITLRQPGLQFVRAVAVSDNHLQSHIFTSRRFWVLSKGDGDGKSESSLSDQEMKVPPQTKSWDWWNCKPKIKGCFTSPGTLEVFWDAHGKAAKKQIKSYQIYLNGVSYCQKFPSSTNSLKLVGLAGGRKYNITVEVFPQHDKNQVLESNTLQLTCPKVAPPGGPVISLESTTDPQTLSVVWMSIDTPQQPIDGYLVYLNDQQCGPKLVPETGSNRCKVVVSGCDTSIDYKLYVLAVSTDGDETKMSNVLVVQLPLDVSNVTLPPVSERVADEEVYQEYVEVLEGSGYLPQMDSPRKKEITPRGKRVVTSTSSGESETESETETETESDSETGSSESETESDDSEHLPRAKQLKQQGAVTLGKSRHISDGLQQAAPLKKEVDVETPDLPEDCARLPVTKSTLRSYSDLDHYQTSRSDLGDINNQTAKVKDDGDSSSGPARKRISLRIVTRTLIQILRASGSSQSSGQAVRKGRGKKSESRVDWENAKQLLNLKQQLRARKEGKDKEEDNRTSKGLKSALKSYPAQDSMQTASIPPPRHGDRLRVEDAAQPRRAEQRMVRSHSDESYDDSEPHRSRPGRGRLQRGHSDSCDYSSYYDDDSKGGDEWQHHHSRGVTPRYSYRDGGMPPRSGIHRQDSFQDDGSDYSDGTVHNHSLSPDPYHHQRHHHHSRHHDRSPDRHYDRSPDRYSHSSYSSSQRRRVSFQDERPSNSRWDRDGGSGQYGSFDIPRTDRSRRRRDSVEISKVYRQQQAEKLTRPRGPRHPGKRDPQPYYGKQHEVYREGMDSDTASDRDSVEHLYISPRYAERMDGDLQSPRKSVQFFLGPSEAEANPQIVVRDPGKGQQPSKPHRGPMVQGECSLDTQLSDDNETLVADEDGCIRYVSQHPYGDVPAYGEDRDSTLPPLPMETGGMLSRFLDIVNHVPFIREDLMGTGDGDDFRSEPLPSASEQQQYSARDEYRKASGEYRLSEVDDRGMVYESQAVSPAVYAESSRKSSFRAAPIQKRGPETTPRIGGLVDDVTTSEESESESDYESGAELPPGGHVVILDASKNQATDTKETLKSRAVGEKGHYREHDDDGDMEVMGHSGKKGKKSGKPMALIQVQKTVALNMDERQVKDSGDIMEKTKLAVSTEQKSMIQIKEGEYVTGDGDGLLPAPSIMATTKGKHTVRVGWELPREPDPQYKLLLYVVNVVGIKFSSEINSDISYECNLVEKGKQVRGVQHCWNIQDSKQCVINGLQPGLTYRIYVICNYSTMHGNKPCEIQTTSSVLYYTTLGPPKAPRLKIVRVDLYQTCIAWEAPPIHENTRLSGYQIQVDGKPLGGQRNPDIQQMVINNLVPGKTISVNVIAVMARASQESAPSKTIHITCPRRPPCPTVAQQPSYKKGCVLLAWDKPRGHPDTNEESITAYSIFVDGQWHGEVKANRMGDQQGYQFFLTDLAPEQSYDVSVKAVAGDRTCDPDSQHVYCLSESFMSNVVPVMAPAAPKSPKLRLEGLHPDGIDVTWQVPQQSGDAHISGYQMLKNGKLYGSVIPPDVNSLRIRDVSLGEKLNLQLIALTEHPVGKSDTRAGSAIGDKDSGISGSTVQHEDRSAVTSPASTKGSQKVVTFTRHVHYGDGAGTNSDVFAGERYTGCKPGPKLVIHYTGLVCPPSEVWCERVTGHSALIVWSKADERKAHYVPADSYQVTWWPGDRPQDEINSDSTTDDHLLITTLRPSTTYTVVVEARKTEKYTDMDEAVSSAETPEGLNAFILSSKSEHLTVKTASPPDPPRNVGVSATTCNSLNVAWDPPQEHGSEVIAIRIECISLNAQDPHHVTEDIMPDSTSCDITGLHEKTDYLVRVIAVTEEYFDRLPDKHKHKKLHAIPRDVLVAQEESPWLPSASLVAKTAGTEAPANIRLSQSTMTALELTWTPPLVYGSNRLLSQIVRWRDVRRTKPTDPEDLIVSSHVNLLSTEDTLKISDLVPGSQYQVVIEAVVSIKTSLNPDQSDSGIEKFRRTAHVMSKPLVVWTRAPIEPPKLLVQSYDQSSAVLYWEKPILMSIIGKDDEGNPRYLRRYLEGYRLEINGKLQSCLGPQAQTCTLTKCKPGKLYSVVLVAMTCTEDRRRERKEKFKGYFKTTAPQDTDYVGLLDDDLLDQAPSEPMEVTLPKSQDGFLETVKTNFIHQEERDNRTFGDVEVIWTIQGQSNLLKQFSIVWFSSEDRVIQTKYVGPEKRRAAIPVTYLKSVYTVTVEPCYYTDVLPQQPQDVHIMIPGPPDAPEIFLRSQDKDEFVVEWGEPRCYGGVKVKGYQVFMNDKKVGNELSNSHRKAIIPCRMNKMYRINLVALSSNPDYQDSPKSNTLVINSGKESAQNSVTIDEHTDDHDLPVKVTGVTESGVHLDWSGFLENQDVAFYKIQWSSVAQPAQREVRLSPKDISCVINKCLPGTTHFVRLIAYNEGGQIIEKSKQLTVQTSAPPDPPVLSVRACNFRYIAIQWEKPTTYGDALITGYKVYVNGIVEAVLSADSLSFTFTQGKWCQEYSFQVQALTAGDSLNSKPSEPLILTWPGTSSPQIRRIPSVSSSSLRVAWNPPQLTDGVKVKHFKLCCVEEDTEKLVQSVGPIHPDSCEAEFKHLKKGGYMVFLETHLYGTGEVVRSEPIRMQPSVCPDPPQISVTIVGLEERRQVEKLTCDLANKRDRLIRSVGHKLKRIGALAHPLRAEKDDDVVMGAHTLTGVEELLESCFLALENYTGQLIAHVSWQCPQTNEDVHLSGFKVLVDGKQYGSSMHSGVRTVRLQLGLDQPSYTLSMVALSDKPQGSSVESAAVELLTSPFRPFSYYCYHNVHSKGTKWPSHGCCKYQDALTYERQVGRKLANQGLLLKHVPPPACSLLDIFGGDYKPLMSGHRPHCPTVLFFWTSWCLSSQKVMDFYIRFAREASKEFNFVAVSCGVSGIATDDRQTLVHQLTSGGWREDGVMWHCTSECATNVYRTISNVNQTTSSLRVDKDLVSEKYMDLTELLGIAGVPTFLFIHPEGYISWHGRYSSYDFPAFSAFMRHTNSEVMRHPCPVFNCDSCKNDMTIDHELIASILPEKVRAAPQTIAIKTLSSANNSESNLNSAAASRTDLKYAAINGFTDSASGTDRVFMARKTSPKRRNKLSINRRPYSASATPQQLQGSPYLAKVVPSASPSRSRNRPVSAKLLHYV